MEDLGKVIGWSGLKITPSKGNILTLNGGDITITDKQTAICSGDFEGNFKVDEILDSNQ